MTHTWRCFECHDLKEDPPCYRSGQPDAATIAAAFVGCIWPDGGTKEEFSWPLACTFEACKRDPTLCWKIIAECLPHLTTARQAATFAAGLPEDFVAQWGEVYIEKIERLANQNPRFRYILTGIWPQGKEAGDVWKRIQKLASSGPSIDAYDPLPPI